LKFRASASHAFRLPDYTDLYYHDPTSLGNPNLKPERAWSYEGGAEYHFNSRLRLEATLFERRDRDVIDYANSASNPVFQALNVDRLNFTGVETSLAYRLSGSELDLSYSGLRGSSQPVPGLQSRYAFNYPVNSAVAAWTGNLSGHIVARTRIGALQRVGHDPYAVWDLYAARPAGSLRPFLQLTNLTNTDYQEISDVVMPGRAVVGGLEIAVPNRVK
jgi:iron complex outermembrane receptor protein